MTEHQIPLQFRPPEVEHPVSEPEFLGREILVLFPRHRNGRRPGRTGHPKVGDVNLDVPRCHAFVPGRIGTEFHPSGNQNHRLDPEPRGLLHHGRQRPGGAERQLHEAIPVSQVDEDETAKITAAVNPAAQADDLAELLPRDRTRAVSSQRGLGGGNRCHGGKRNAAGPTTASNWSKKSYVTLAGRSQDR